MIQSSQQYGLSLKPLNDKDHSELELLDVSTKLLLMILSTNVCIIKSYRPNDSIREMYEHVMRILKHKHKFELNKKETYLPLLNSTQLNSRNNIFYSKI